MSQPLDYFRYSGKELSVDGVKLSKIADKVGTPVYVYSAKAFLEPLAKLQKGLKGLDAFVCYAVKSNSNLSVLKLLASHGAGMDLVSGGELFRAGAAGVAPKKIVFSGVGKTPGEMAAALEYGGAGISSFNVESEMELATLSYVAKELGKIAPVVLRFNPNVNPKTHPYISTGLKKNKFGLSLEEILEIAHSAGNYPGVRIDGLSIHIGSQLLSLSPLGESFSKVAELLVKMESILDRPLKHVDLGGGLGISYKGEKPPKIEDYCRLIHRHFGVKSPFKSRLRISIEPGRVLSGNAGVLVTEVLYRKIRKQKDFLIVDAGMNDLIRPALYDSHHEIVPVEKIPGSLKKTDIVGPVCETGDFFARERKLSTQIAPGSLLAVLSAGAYGFTMSSNYNSRSRPAEVLVEKGRFRVIRTRETYEDLIRGE
jgi:diaminopimelate decarboxylase